MHSRICNNPYLKSKADEQAGLSSTTELSTGSLGLLIAEGLKVPAAQNVRSFDIQAIVLNHLSSRELAGYCKVDRLAGVHVRQSQEHFVFFSSFVQGRGLPEGFNAKLLSNRFDLRIKAARESLESAETTPEMRQVILKRALAEAFFELAVGYHQELPIRYLTLGLSHNVALAKHCLEQMLFLSREEVLLKDVQYLAKAQLALHEGKSGAALVYFGRAVGANNAYAKLILGIAYERGAFGFSENQAEARRNYQEAAALDCSVALYNLGVAYEFGKHGLPRDETAALRHYRKAAALGCPSAFSSLGGAYQYGKFGLPKDEAVALRLLREGAALGCPYACYALAWAHELGELGLTKDKAVALRFYRDAAAFGMQ